MVSKVAISWALGTIVSMFTVIGGIAVVWGMLTTDIELLATAAAAETARVIIEQKHELDISQIEQASKDARIDTLDLQVKQLDEEIRFGTLTADQKEFKETWRTELKLKKQNILEDIE
jgi:hypothetical protein